MSATGPETAPRTRAGPSKPAAKPKRKQGKSQTVPETEESEDVVQIDSGEDEITEVEPPRTRKPAPRPVNGKSAVAKGKGKAQTDQASKKKAAVRDVEPVDDEDDEMGLVGTARAINNAPTTSKAAKRDLGSTTKENDRLRRQLAAAHAKIEDLSKQLEESYRVRYTEPEELMKRQAEKYEELIRTKDLLLKQQEEMLARKEPLSTDGKNSVLHMVTRETADAEKRSAEEQIAYWKDRADKKEGDLRTLTAENEELKQIQSDLRYEIKTERELAQKASQNAHSAPRTRGPNPVLGADDPKHAQLVSFYEDVTNLLITDIKVQEPKYLDLEGWIMTCIYTHTASRRSLSFHLNFSWDPIDPFQEVQSSADLEKATTYSPLELGNEPQEFVDALDFLQGGFTFPRDQLPIFFKSLVDLMKAACEGAGQSPDGSMEGVEPTD